MNNFCCFYIAFSFYISKSLLIKEKAFALQWFYKLRCASVNRGVWYCRCFISGTSAYFLVRGNRYRCPLFWCSPKERTQILRYCHDCFLFCNTYRSFGRAWSPLCSAEQESYCPPPQCQICQSRQWQFPTRSFSGSRQNRLPAQQHWERSLLFCRQP